MQKIKYLNQSNVSYILGLIRDIVNQPNIIDDVNLSTSTSMSSVKIDSLLTTLKTDLQTDYRSLIANLNRLKKLVVTSLPTTNIDVDTLYMLKKTDANGDEYFEQYLYLNSTWELVATTKVADSNGIEIYDDNKQYVINDTVLYKGTTDAYYSVYICINPTTGTFVPADWEVVDEKQEFLIIGSTQPSNTNVFWIDTTDSTKPLLKFYDGTNWKSISGSGGSGIPQYDDYSSLPLVANGNTSTDLVDNRYVFVNNDYTDSATNIKYKNGFYKYSSTEDEWTPVYEIDIDDCVKKMGGYIQEANLRTYTGEELDYGEFTLSPLTITCSAGATIPLAKVSGNIDLDVNSYIVLNANKTYEISFTTVCSARADIMVFDNNGNALSDHIFISNGPLSASIDWVIPPSEEDRQICFKITDATSNPIMYSAHTSVVIREINRQIIIDANKICDENVGVEAVPVGNVIELAGTKAPTHYLLCDGSEYNIADYPKLAQHFLDNYGSVNYFGGDGITTFAVPLYEIIYDSIVPQMMGYSQDGYVVSASSEFDSTNYLAWKVFDKCTSAEGSSGYRGSWATASGQTTGWVQIQIPSPRKIKKYTLRARNILNNPTSITSFIDFQLLGSNDGITWDTLHSATNETTWSMNEQREYNVSTNNYYSYYRLNVSKSSGAPYVDIDEIDLIGCTKIYCIKAEPTYYIDNSTIGDTIAPNASNTDSTFKLDITHADGSVDTTPNLKGVDGADGVILNNVGYYGFRVVDGRLKLYVNVADATAEDVDAQAPPFSLVEKNGVKHLFYTVGGIIQYESKTTL